MFFLIFKFLHVFFQLFLALFIINFVIGGLSIAPFVPTKKKDVERVLELLDLKDDQNFYELGCGDGRIIFEAVKRKKIKATGIEIVFPLYLLCQIKRFFSKQRKNIKIKFGDALKEDLSEANVVYFFAMPKSIKKELKQKLQKELKKGTKIVSYAFPIEGWKEKMVSWPPNEIPIYVYEKE